MAEKSFWSLVGGGRTAPGDLSKNQSAAGMRRLGMIVVVIERSRPMMRAGDS